MDEQGSMGKQVTSEGTEAEESEKMSGKINRIRKNRKGVTSLLAMMYLVIFSALAIGFYTTTTTAVQVVDNEKRITLAHVAAEGGMDFMRFQLANVDLITTNDPDQTWDELTAQLKAMLEGTGNMGTKTVYIDSEVMRIPASPDDYISIDNSGTQFQAVIENLGHKVRVKTVGKYGNYTLARAIQLEYAKAQKVSQIFDFGVASKGPISLKSNAKIRGASDPKKGSVLSANKTVASPVVVDGNSSISGDVSLESSTASVTVSTNGSIAGSSNPAVYNTHIHKGVPEVEFPNVDTDIFKPYATNILSIPNKQYDSGTIINPLIKANTNPIFASNMTVQGVIYIETPNHVRFDSNVNVHGVIVVQNNPTGDTTTNTLTFQSNVKLISVDTLPDTADFPESLRKLTGSMILAPTFHILFNSNVGSVGGTIVADSMHFDSNASGTIAGSLINLADIPLTFNSNAEVTIASVGTTKYPAGLTFNSIYVPLHDTYEEVLP